MTHYTPSELARATDQTTPSRGLENRVDAKSLHWRTMLPAWDLIHDLLGGTHRMRERGTRWLPKEEAEEDAAWRARRERSTLYGMLKDTIENLVSKPFSKPVTRQGELPEMLAEIEDDVDRTGTCDLTKFARDLFTAGLRDGLAFILVDFPDTGGGRLSLAEERERGVRPTFALIEADRVIGYRVDPSLEVAGQEVLAQVRIREWRVEPFGLYGDREVEYVRVITGPSGDGQPGTFELWRRNPDGEARDDWERLSAGVHTYPGVPLVAFYTGQSAFMLAEPPLEDLAWLNLEHWQKKSDLDNALHHSTFPMLFMSGLSREERDKKTRIGPTRTFKSINERSDMKWVEMTGSAIEKAQEDLAKLEERAEVLGLEPLVDRVTTTATGKVKQDSRRGNSIQAWIRDLEGAVEDAYSVAATWAGQKIEDDDFGVDVFSDFGITARGAEDVREIRELKRDRIISHKTCLIEVKRRGVLSEQLDVDDEIQAVEDEGPSMEEMRAQAEMDAREGDDDDDETESGPIPFAS